MGNVIAFGVIRFTFLHDEGLGGYVITRSTFMCGGQIAEVGWGYTGRSLQQ